MGQKELRPPYDKLVNDLINQKDQSLRQQAQAILVQMGETSIPALLVALEKNDTSLEAMPHQTREVMDALVQLGEPALLALITAIKWPADQSHESRRLARAATKLLSRFDDERAVATLLESARDRSVWPIVRNYAVIVLQQFRSRPDVVAVLKAIIADNAEDEVIRENAELSLLDRGTLLTRR